MPKLLGGVISGFLIFKIGNFSRFLISTWRYLGAHTYSSTVFIHLNFVSWKFKSFLKNFGQTKNYTVFLNLINKDKNLWRQLHSMHLSMKTSFIFCLKLHSWQLFAYPYLYFWLELKEHDVILKSFTANVSGSRPGPGTIIPLLRMQEI